MLLDRLSRVILFGAGSAGLDAVWYLEQKNVNVMFFCDNDHAKHGNIIAGKEIYHPKILLDYQDDVVLITSDYAKEIGKQLQGLGIKKFYYFGYCHDYERWHNHFNPGLIQDAFREIDQVRNLFSDDSSRLMFERLISFRMTSDPTHVSVSDYDDYWHPSVYPAPGDVIIDAGAWTGDTARFFAQRLKGECFVLSFEPDGRNYRMLQENISKFDLVSIVKPINLGIWNTNTFLNFNDSIKKSEQFRIDETGDKEIEVVSLDSFIKTKALSVDLIKMDIEGAEYEAISGSKNIIKKFAPKLQICIYHKPDDLWKIPILIKKLNSNYKLYLGVHKQHFIDTVLYATVK
jgi:FkbM family methyltransferase